MTMEEALKCPEERYHWEIIMDEIEEKTELKSAIIKNPSWKLINNKAAYFQNKQTTKTLDNTW